jgi:hypothetical protein
MIDYILRFPSKATAEQFGLASGFAHTDDNGVVCSSIASHEHALYEIGEHNGDGQYWVLFRDLVGIPVPEGGQQFIYWSSDSNAPRPIDDQNVPNIWWA